MLAVWIRHAFSQGWVCIRSYQRGSGHEARDKHVKDPYRPTLEECLTWADAGGNVEVLLHESNLLQVDAEAGAPDPWGDPAAHGTVICRSASGGLHALYKRPESLRQHRWIRPVPLVDLLSKGVWPLPGCKRDGSASKPAGEWSQLADPCEPAPAPDWVLAAVPRARHAPTPHALPAVHGHGWGAAALKGEAAALAAVQPGGVNDALCRSAFRVGQALDAGGLNQAEAEEVLVQASIRPGWDERKSRDTAHRAMEAGKRAPRGPAPREVPVQVVMRKASEPPTLTPETLSPGPRTILIPGGHPTPAGWVEQTPDGFAAESIAAMPVGSLYRRGSVAGELVGPAGEREFRPLEVDRVRCVASRHARPVEWYTPRATKADPEPAPCERYVPLSRDHASVIMARASDHENARQLRWVSPYPFCAPGPTVITTAGYHEPGFFFDPPPGLSIPTVTDPAVIRDALADLTTDFPFEDEESRQNFYGFLLTPILRPAIDGNVPIHAFTSSIARSGKSRLIEQVAGITVTGRKIPASQIPARPEDQPKWLFSIALAGASLLHIDNLPPELDSGPLASMVTSETISDRLLGGNRWVTVNNTLTVAVSGNNVRLTGELAKRSVIVRLVPATDHPEDRTDFRHPRLATYLHERRPHLLGCLLGAVALWHAAGSPQAPGPFGGFEEWAAVVGGVLAVSGLTKHLGNRVRWRERADSEGEALDGLVRAWWGRFGSLAVNPTQMLACLPDAAGELLERPTAIGLGKRLAGLVDRRFALGGMPEVMVQRWTLPDEHSRGYRLDPVR